jgi:geranylgeranylglycerol-phosphate geranylgeranyltransferase
MLGTMACMVVNDLYDVEKDRAARVNRAIAAGRLSAGTAAAYAALLVVAAVAAAPRTGAGLGLGAVAIALGVLYSVFARAFPVLKGFYTAGCCCLPLVYGAAVTGARAGAVALAGVALFNAGRETFLDAHHVAGDRRFGVRTLGVLLGPRRARALGIGVMFAGTLVLFPGVTTPSGRSSVAAALALLALAVFVLRADDEGLRQWTRVVMVIGAVAAASSVH